MPVLRSRGLERVSRGRQEVTVRSLRPPLALELTASHLISLDLPGAPETLSGSTLIGARTSVRLKPRPMSSPRSRTWPSAGPPRPRTRAGDPSVEASIGDPQVHLDRGGTHDVGEQRAGESPRRGLYLPVGATSSPGLVRHPACSNRPRLGHRRLRWPPVARRRGRSQGDCLMDRASILRHVRSGPTRMNWSHAARANSVGGPAP